MVHQELITCEELKEYTSWICCETYPDVDEHEREAETIEKDWPTFKDDRQLGRVPDFVWQDKADRHIHSDGITMEELKTEGR